jgi:hypothetical protein
MRMTKYRFCVLRQKKCFFGTEWVQNKSQHFEFARAKPYIEYVHTLRCD